MMINQLMDCPCCGTTPNICQWKDTITPNATWIECECGIMTDSTHHEDSNEAKNLAIKIWNGNRELKKEANDE
jgi:hypothetical protein